MKLFGKAHVDVNLSLGQFTKVKQTSSVGKLFIRNVVIVINPIFLFFQSRNIDNEFDFQQMAYFKTRIGISNSYQVRLERFCSRLSAVIYPLNQEKMTGQRGRLLFRRAKVFVLAEVCLPRRPYAGQPRSDV